MMLVTEQQETTMDSLKRRAKDWEARNAEKVRSQTAERVKKHRSGHQDQYREYMREYMRQSRTAKAAKL